MGAHRCSTGVAPLLLGTWADTRVHTTVRYIVGVLHKVVWSPT